MWLASALELLLAASPLQPLIDAAPEGSTLVVPAGEYTGPVVVKTSLTIDGRGAATIHGGGVGTVVTLHAPHTTLKGFTITGSGASHDQQDAAILVDADEVRVEHNVISDALFGVLLLNSSRSTVCGNRISSKAEEPGLRGDAVRVWAGGFNHVVGNDVTLARDLSLANSSNDVIAFNVVRAGRTGVHLVFAPRATLDHNWLDANLTGIAVLYSNDVTITANRVQHSRGNAGTGLTFKDSNGALVVRNAFVHNGTGAKLNAPTSPDGVITFRENTFAHNVTGIDFYGENGGHVLERNRFDENLTQVGVSAPMSARGNTWRANWWDDYAGFDRDGDGVGDTPHERYFFADRIWMETPQATFFRNAPAFELLDLLERLAPFATPELILRDDRPSMSNVFPDTPEAPPPAPFCP